MVLKTSLAFLLVFRLNRCAMRFWEARGYWGTLTHTIRNLVSGILMYLDHAKANRDMAIRWTASFCVASMHFIRSEDDYNPDELAGILSPDQIRKMQDADHAPLHAATMIRYYLLRALRVDRKTPPHLAHAQSIQLNALEQHVTRLIAQVSGMEKIRSTPLPIAYVTHLRSLLFLYCLLLPYVWVKDWQWATLPLYVKRINVYCLLVYFPTLVFLIGYSRFVHSVTFTAFALFGIEGVSSEVEVPFDRSRANHLALDAYCLIMINSIQSVVVHHANLDMQGGEDTVDKKHDVEFGVHKFQTKT